MKLPYQRKYIKSLKITIFDSKSVGEFEAKEMQVGGYNERETASIPEAVSLITVKVSVTLQLLHQHRLRRQQHQCLLFQPTNHVRSSN